MATEAALQLLQAELTAVPLDSARIRETLDGHRLADDDRWPGEATSLLLGRADALRRQKLYDDAIELLLLASERFVDERIDARLAALHTDRGVSRGNSGDWDRCLFDLWRALGLNSRSPRVRRNLIIGCCNYAMVALRRSDVQRATECLDRLLGLFGEWRFDSKDLVEQHSSEVFCLRMMCAGAGAALVRKES